MPASSNVGHQMSLLTPGLEMQYCKPVILLKDDYYESPRAKHLQAHWKEDPG